jgi:hypothetical protein
VSIVATFFLLKKISVSENTSTSEAHHEKYPIKRVDFCVTLYHLFPKRKDAIFKLVYANSVSTTSLNSVVHLSESAFFTRQCPSITDALTDGLGAAQWYDIQKLIWCTNQPKDKACYHRIEVDCTPQDRLHEKHWMIAPLPAKAHCPQRLHCPKS